VEKESRPNLHLHMFILRERCLSVKSAVALACTPSLFLYICLHYITYFLFVYSRFFFLIIATLVDIHPECSLTKRSHMVGRYNCIFKSQTILLPLKRNNTILAMADAPLLPCCHRDLGVARARQLHSWTKHAIVSYQRFSPGCNLGIKTVVKSSFFETSLARCLCSGETYPTATKYSDARMTRRGPRSKNMAPCVGHIVPKTLLKRGA
jgi:hypothetical protein